MPSELPFQTALCPNDSISSAFFTFNNQICPNHRHPSRHRSHRQQKIEIDDEGQVSDTSAANAVTMPIAKSFSDSFSKGFAHRTDTAGRAARAWRFFVLRLFTGCLRCLRPSENLGIWFSDGLLLFALQIRQIKRFAVTFGQNGVDAGGKFNGGHHDAVRTGGHGENADAVSLFRQPRNAVLQKFFQLEFSHRFALGFHHFGKFLLRPHGQESCPTIVHPETAFAFVVGQHIQRFRLGDVFQCVQAAFVGGGLRMLSMACCG